MNAYLQAAIVFTCGEACGLVIFPIISHLLGPKDTPPWDGMSILKGILERMVLFTALLNDYPQMLIALGAMKLGTRLHHEEDAEKSEISNTYFLVGNLLSFFIAIVGAVVAKRISGL